MLGYTGTWRGNKVTIQEKKFGSKSRKIIQILTVKEALKNVLLIV